MYSEETYKAILERMLSRVSSTLDKREGSVIFDALSPAAIELAILYIELSEIMKNAFADTASRDYLIRRAAERGIEPGEATYAVLRGEFEPTTVNVLGRRFNGDTLNYTVTKKLSDGVYELTCETVGSAGNEYFGTLTPIGVTDGSGLTSAVLTSVIIPGEDEEDTEVFRQRYLKAVKETPFGGNRADYIGKVNSIPGVGGVKVKRVWNADITPASMAPNATVQSWYEEYIGTALASDVRNWLNAVYEAAVYGWLTVGGTVLVTVVSADSYGECAPALVAEIQTAIDPTENAGEGYGIAPIGHVVTVQSAAQQPLDVYGEFALNTGYTWEGVRPDIEDAIEEYFLELRKSWADNDATVVRISHVEMAILSVRGVQDVQNLRVGGEDRNFTLENNEVPVLGEVTNLE